MALDALDDLVAVCERYPEARAELVADLGEPLVLEVMAARAVLARAASGIDNGSGGALSTAE